jgi:hypothetical protein
MSGHALLVNLAAEPIPPSDILRRLKQVHPALGLKFYEPGAGVSSWAVTWKWRDDDPRRERIRRQEIPPDADIDIIAWLPLGCSVDEAAGFVERAVRHYPRDDIRALCDRLHHYNRVEAVQENWREVESRVMTRAEDLGKAATPRSVVPADLERPPQPQDTAGAAAPA